MSANDVMKARVVEVGEAAAGIAVPDRADTMRLFSAGRDFHRLDGRIFRSIDEAFCAARDLVRRGDRTSPRGGGAEDPTAELVLAAPDPFLLPV